MRTSILSLEKADELVEEVASEKVTALLKAVDLSTISGAPEWIIRLVLSDLQPLLAKPPSRWRREEIAQLQESVDTLPRRLVAAVLSDPSVI